MRIVAYQKEEAPEEKAERLKTEGLYSG